MGCCRLRRCVAVLRRSLGLATVRYSTITEALAEHQIDSVLNDPRVMNGHICCQEHPYYFEANHRSSKMHLLEFPGILS